MAVAYRLQSEGHAVVFAVHPRLQPLIARAGLKVINGFTWGYELLDTPTAGTLRDRAPWSRQLHHLFAHIGQAATVLSALLQRWKADVLVSSELPVASIAAEIVNIPYATLYGLTFPLSGSTLPPYGSGISPYARFNLRWLVYRLWWLTLAQIGDRAVNRVRQAYKLQPIAHHGLFLPSPYLVLTFTTDILEYRRPDLPPQVWFTGPTLPLEDDDPMLDMPWDWIMTASPLMFIDLEGSVCQDISDGSLRFLRALLQSSLDHSWRMLVKVKQPAKIQKKLGHLPPNVVLASHIQTQRILQYAQVTVCHGSDAIVSTSLSAGVPLLMAPITKNQIEISQRVVERGAGLCLPPRQHRSKSISHTLFRILHEPGLRLSARQIAADFAHCDGPGSAAQLLIELATARHPIHRSLGQSPTRYRESTCCEE